MTEAIPLLRTNSFDGIFGEIKVHVITFKKRTSRVRDLIKQFHSYITITYYFMYYNALCNISFKVYSYLYTKINAKLTALIDEIMNFIASRNDLFSSQV